MGAPQRTPLRGLRMQVQQQERQDEAISDAAISDAPAGDVLRETPHPPNLDPSGAEPQAADVARTRAVLLLVAALYGTNFGSIKVMQEAIVPADAALLRFTIALLALSPYLRTTPAALWRPGIGIGVWVALGYIVQGIGLNSGSDASTAAFLCSLAVVVCPLLEALDGTKVSANTWRAAALAVSGVGVLELGGGVQPSVGDLWSLLQPIGFGVGFYKISRVMKDFPGMGKQLTAIQLVVVWITSVVWALGVHQGAPDWGQLQSAMSHLDVASSVVWTGLVTTALTVLLQTTSLGVLSPSETTVLYSTEPIWAAAFANVVLGETFGTSTFVGGGMIIAACIASAISPSELKKVFLKDTSDD
eukprot:Tamp_16782.p1 GENE.Tamp_16782~~Tamp_16782.p1  ORF type:complete len:392 (+),score=64.22 Tamp_16782:98-1177(+)